MSMMNVCEEHDDAKVVYDGKDCPFCEAVLKIDALKEEVEGLEDQVEDLQETENE